jgi:hypothetical protein
VDELTEQVERMRRQAARIVNLRTMMEQDIKPRRATPAPTRTVPMMS